MRTRTFSAVVAVCSLAAAASSAPAWPQDLGHPAVTPGCFPKGSATIRRNSVARVFLLPNTYTGGDEVWGCAYRRGEAYDLGSRQPIERTGSIVGRIRLAGSFVAWETASFDEDGGTSAEVDVADLRTETPLADWSPSITDCYGVAASRLKALVLSPHGSAAWIASVASGCSTTFEVWTFVRHSRVKLRASSPTIIPRSLRLAGRRVSWRDAGVRRSVRLR